MTEKDFIIDMTFRKYTSLHVQHRLPARVSFYSLLPLSQSESQIFGRRQQEIELRPNGLVFRCLFLSYEPYVEPLEHPGEQDVQHLLRQLLSRADALPHAEGDNEVTLLPLL